jgi:predicted DNA-binding protein (UPF0251 family)/predicted RNA-binding Zn-ribbon protein involved in translation (DUF1610 family)
MSRPRKYRKLTREPRPIIFKPVGAPLQSVDCVTLFYEELEALRLADLQGQNQANGARQMEVSRSTFQRILQQARHKVASALVEGNALQVEGGTFRVATVRWHCSECGHDWAISHGSAQGQNEACPMCGSLSIRRRPQERRRHLE